MIFEQDYAGFGDALHIAIATVEKVDFIATWNFKHINNPFTKNNIKKIIEEAGYICPILTSPEELLEEELGKIHL